MGSVPYRDVPLDANAGYLVGGGHMAQDQIRVVSAEIVQRGRYLLVQRSEGATLPLLWEFPGGRVREEESDEEALHRSLSERIGCVGSVGERVLEVVHPYEGYDLTLLVYRCTIEDVPVPGTVQQLAWVEPDSFGDYTFPGADQRTLDALLGR